MIVLTGATGTVGSFVSEQLSEAGVKHRVIARSPEKAKKNPNVEVVKGTYDDKAALDSAFKGAQSASGMPDRTTGFVYANLQDALPVVKGLASLAGATLPAGGADLGALRTLTAYGAGGSGGVSSFTLFLEVR